MPSIFRSSPPITVPVSLFKQIYIYIYSTTPLIRNLVIRIANYPERFGVLDKCVENSKKLTCLEITGYRIKYSTVLWLLEIQIKRGREV